MSGRTAALLLLVLLPLGLFREPLLGRKVFYSLDVLAYVEPKSAEILRAVHERRFPLWTTSLSCGLPFFAEVDHAVLNPFNLLLPLGPRRWVEVAAPLWCALAGLALFAFLREWRLGLAASACGALAYGASGFLVSYFDNPPYLNAAFYLPLVLLLWHRALARSSPAWLLATAAALALMLTAGDVQTLYDTVLLALPYGLVVPAGGRRSVRALRAVAGWTVLGAAAVALAAVQLVPTLELLEQAPRQQTLSEAYEPSFHPARMLELVIPFAYGMDLPGSPYWGRFLHTPVSPRPWTRSVYSGLLALALLPLAFAARRTRALAGFAAAAGGIALLASFGPALPVYAWLYRWLPLFSRFRAPAKLWIVVVLALAVLAGLGVERALGSERRRAPLTAAGLAALLALAGLGLRFAPLPPLPALTLAGGALRLAVVASALTLALAVAAAGRRRLAGVLVVAVSAADLASASAPLALYFGDPRVVPSEPPEAARVLLGLNEKRAVPFRMFHHVDLLEGRGFVPPPGLNPLERAKLWDRLSLDWDHAWTWGLDEVFGYTVLQDGRPLALRLHLRRDEGALVPALGRLGVGVLLLPGERPLPAGTRPLASAEGGAIRLAAVEAALPRVFLARHGRTVASPDLALAGLVHPAFDPTRLALLELAPDALPFAGTPSSAPLGELRVVSYRPGEVVVDVRAPEPRYVVLSESLYRGWKAWVDGAERPIARANFLMQAVAVRAGERRVVFRYAPDSFVRGLVVSGVAWAALATGLIWLGLRRSRRRREATLAARAAAGGGSP